ncbi:hypothetical protein IBT47_07340 [Erwinia sp. S43]|uniref:hypothetical protein n=1 Tax=Erwinia sp. S43 TaxID=2769339 RepID=UPI00190B6F57|nr:hypothetical protein [Erwinia sp. S43]MBK0032092.1 hypothetical protein [Erwinia sp. S43]
MPLPARMKPVRASRMKIKALAEKADEILTMIDTGSDENDETLNAFIAEWNSQVPNPYAYSNFRDFSSWTSAKQFTKIAFNQEKFYEDLTWEELVQLITFIYQAEGSEADVDFALRLLEKNFTANPSDLMFWPNEWFKDETNLHISLSAEEMGGYLMAASNRYVAGAPEIELKYSLPVGGWD